MIRGSRRGRGVRGKTSTPAAGTNRYVASLIGRGIDANQYNEAQLILIMHRWSWISNVRDNTWRTRLGTVLGWSIIIIPKMISTCLCADCWSLSFWIPRRIRISITLDSVLTSRVPRRWATLYQDLRQQETRHGNTPTQKILLILIKGFSY